MSSVSPRQRQRLTVRGLVQGVGFRPFVHGAARRHGLAGFVTNTLAGVVIEVEGAAAGLTAFVDDLARRPPPLALIQGIAREELAPLGAIDFVILPSAAPGPMATWIAPDSALCPDCLAEFREPTDRRYHYPFINCTNCGPRFTITDNIPYDRPFTSMRGFVMCPACQDEYNDPASRRFHAQPNACPLCGPHLELLDAAGQKLAGPEQAAELARQALVDGKIVAVKGLGGFHLAVDAASEQAVLRLRQRKGRPAKPLAVMVADLATAQRFCYLEPAEIEALVSPAAPIVLARKRLGHGLAEAVAPGQDRFGVMLPSTPLHHLLFPGACPVLVMTSANFSEEPLCADNDEALRRLAGIADLLLLHDRDIYLANDDSVVIHLAGAMRQVRRSRGYVPRPIEIDHSGPPVLGVGGELKNTVCLLRADQAIVSQHLGDLKNPAGYGLFQKTIAHLSRIFTTVPELVVHDLHPGYLSTRWALEQDIPTLAVQHHHAHLAACLAENRFTGPAIGLIMDGTGLGTDHTIWGGEVLVGDASTFQRFAAFTPMPLPGGDRAVREPWRAALGYLYTVFGDRLPDLPFLDDHDVGPVLEILARDLNCPSTTSCGRLFDAVAAMSNGCQVIGYEAQAAIEFMVAGNSAEAPPFEFSLRPGDDRLIMEVAPMIHGVVAAVQHGEGLAEISRRFHRTLVLLLAEVASRARQAAGLNTVALSGGVFQNQVLLPALMSELSSAGFDILTHTQLPSGDGCLSLGQAVIGRRSLADKLGSNRTLIPH